MHVMSYNWLSKCCTLSCRRCSRSSWILSVATGASNTYTHSCVDNAEKRIFNTTCQQNQTDQNENKNFGRSRWKWNYFSEFSWVHDFFGYLVFCVLYDSNRIKFQLIVCLFFLTHTRISMTANLNKKNCE